MEDKVIIIAYANGETVSRREMTLHQYYDDTHPEIDDDAYIRQHHINMVELQIYADGNSMKARNHYNPNGEPFKFEKWENGEYEVEEW